MLSQKTKQTNRKFYGKWLYKVTLEISGCSLLRTKTPDEIIEFCNLEEEPSRNYYSTLQRAWNNRETLGDFCSLLQTLDSNLYSYRIENSSIDLYTNDRSIYDNTSMLFENNLEHRFEPDEKTIELLSENNNFIVVDRLPKNRYNFRVYLLPHKMKGDKEGKEKYLEWLKKQSPKITCTPAIENWFIKTEWNWDRRYVLVEDEATLLMLKLRNSEVVGRVYNFVISDK